MEAKRISSKKAFELLEQYNSAIEIYGSTTGKRVNLKACIDVCRTVDDMIEEAAYEDAYKALLLYGGYDRLYTAKELGYRICDSNEDEKRKVYASIALIKLHIKKHYSCYMPFAQGAVKSVIVWKNRYEVFFENMAFVYSKESDKVYFMCFIDDYRRYIIKREVEIVRKSQANCIKGFDKFLIK